MPDRLIQLIAAVVLVAGIAGAFLLTPTINGQRLERQLTYDVEVGDSPDPTYTFLSMLGSFRGVGVNILWQRAEELKQEEKFYEANNLAEWITSLQPRYPEAWNFQAWNMAYNISVKCKTAEERWDWVKKGIDLLRDRGIPNNPNAVVLYRSLAWTLGHKMTGQTDDMHWYYKARFAETWQTLLGVPDKRWVFKPEFADPENRPADEEIDPLVHGLWIATDQFGEINTMAQTYLRKPRRDEGDYNASNYFKTLSPDALARFYKDHPGLKPIVKELEALKGPDGELLEFGLNTRTLRAFGRMQMYNDAGYPLQSPVVNNPEALGVDAMTVFTWLGSRDSRVMLNLNPLVNIDAQRKRLQAQNPDADIVDLVPMLNLLRALALVGEYHMDPAYMLACMDRFGPIDWRHPAGHAVYWTALGTSRAEKWTQNKDRVDFINANRATIHSLQHLSHNGTITYRPTVPGLGELGQESINHAPDTRMIPAYNTAWQDTMDKLEAGDFGDNANTSTYSTGHENFLQAAVYLYYFKGRMDLASKYFEKCKALYDRPDNMQSPAMADGDYNLSISDFARVRLEDDLGFQGVAMIDFWIRQAWSRGLAERDPSVMARYLGAAKETYDSFLEDRQNTRKSDLSAQARQGLPPFEDLVLQAFLELMSTTDYSLPQKSGIWQLAAPLLAGISEKRPLVFEAYMFMQRTIQAQAQAEGWEIDLRSAFPEPKGFAQWYQQQQQNTPAPLRPGA